MMQKRFFAILLTTLLLCFSAHAQAASSERLNIYIDKGALLAHDISAADIRIRPEEGVVVTRHSLWPHDEDGNAFTLFVEIQNLSFEKLVLDDNWLYACRASRADIAVANIDASEDPIDYVTRVVYPGQKAVVHAGIWPRLERTGKDAFQEIYGLSDFAKHIRRADLLRLRFNYHGLESAVKCYPVDIEADAWIDSGTLHFETTNTADQPAEYYHIGVIVSDSQGRIIDLLSTVYTDDAVLEPGQTLSLQKELQPYITEDMTGGATFEVFAYPWPYAVK